MEVYERIKLLRKQLGMSAEQVADKLGVSPATIYRYEKNDIKKFPSDILTPLAKILHTTPAYLMGWEDNNNLKAPEIATETVSIPVIGEIAAGYDSFAFEDWSGDTEEVPLSFLKGRSKEDFFFLTVKGDSMYPRFLSGDKVLILKQSTLNNSGDVGAILYDDDIATLKKVEFRQGEDWLKLIPINPEYQEKIIEGEALEHCRVIGIPKLLIREIEQ